MIIGAIPAKISPPRSQSVHARTDVFKIFDNARKRPVVWVTGPPGSGKTTLTSSYLEQRRLPSLWYQCDKGDADLATFYYYFGQAADQIPSERHDSLPLFTPEYLLGSTTFAKNFFRDVNSRITPPFVVILDNYQEIPFDTEFHQHIASGLEEVSEGVTFVIISRDDPPPALARLEVNQCVERIGWKTLKLSRAEIAAVCKRLGDGTVSGEDVEFLQERTDGWIAGVILILELAKRSSLDMQSIVETTPQLMFDYFAGEVFDKTDASTQDLLMRTAWMPTVPTAAAEKLSGSANAGQILDSLSNRHFFTDRIDHSHSLYRYHPLFGQFLRNRATQCFSTEQLCGLQKQAAELLEAGDQIEPAVELLITAKSWEQASQLIARHASQLLTEGRNRTLMSWLEALPAAHTDEDAWCLFWHGSAAAPFAPAEARNDLERALRRFMAAREAAGIFQSWSAIVDSYSGAYIDAKQLDKWLTVLDEIRREYPKYPSSEVEARVSAAAFFALIWRQPHHPDVRTWRDRVETLLLDSTNPSQRILLGSQLFQYCCWTGDAARAKFVFDTLSKSAALPGIAPIVRIHWWYLAATYYWLVAGSPEQCRETIESGLELARKTGVHVFDKFLLGVHVQINLSLGNRDAAAHYLEEMAGVQEGGRLSRGSFYDSLASWHSLQCGDVEHAMQYATRSLASTREAGTPLPEASDHLRVAHALIESGRYEEGSEHVSKAKRIAEDMHSLVIQHECLLTEARIYLARGEHEPGLERLREALAMGKKSGFRITPFALPIIDAELYATALEHGIEVDHVRKVISTRGIFPETPPYHLDEWPWQLKIHTFGGFEVFLGGRPLKFSAQAQRKRLAMLKVLVAFGGRAVDEDRLCDAVWPDADGASAHQGFATTLHRLRKMLGSADALVLRDRQLSLNPRLCWVDIWALENWAGQIEAADPALSGRELTLAEKALTIYRGPFLGQEDHPWAVAPRDRARSRLVRVVTRVSRHLRETGQSDRAVTCLQKGLEVDPLGEEVYRELMDLLSELNRPAEALAVYERCQEELRAALGVAPSERTRMLYEKLRIRFTQ